MKIVICIASLVVAGVTSVWAGETATKAKPYPLTTCIVTDEPLDSMGDPVVFTYKDREIKVCCSPCKTDFLAEPEKYLKMIDDAVAAKKHENQ